MNPVLIRLRQRLDERRWRDYTKVPGSPGIFFHWQPQLRWAMALTEKFLLDWLSKEDSSALGECKGETLTSLISKGLAEIIRPEAGDYAGVRLTEAGMREAVRGRNS